MPPVAPRFRTDETGAVLVLWGLAFGVFLGLVALTFDLGRLSITQTELQSYADSVALAAAGELDGGDGAIARATAAAAAAIADSQTFGTGAQALSSADYTVPTFRPPSANPSFMPTITTIPRRSHSPVRHPCSWGS